MNELILHTSRIKQEAREIRNIIFQLRQDGVIPDGAFLNILDRIYHIDKTLAIIENKVNKSK